ncbi:MAG: BspA family leucine-rich repeat surface protein [Bacilli bacterium]|nr:BspA family leucine-rich repeat surface protein [Bacilli bacterium]
MRKVVLTIMLFFMFLPLIYGESCDVNKISIDSISIEEMTGSVSEKNNASINGNSINLDLSMSNVGDSITYRIVVKNDSNENFEIDETDLNTKSDYIKYYFDNEDSVIVKAKSTKTISLKAEYENEVPTSLIQNDVYKEKEDFSFVISTLTNPKTGDRAFMLICIILILSIVAFLFLKNEKRISVLNILIILIIIPMAVYATCKVDVMIESNIEIKKIAEFDMGIVVNNKMKAMASNGYFEPVDPGIALEGTIPNVGMNGMNKIGSFKRSETLPQEIKTKVDNQIAELNSFEISDEEKNEAIERSKAQIHTVDSLTITEENGVKTACFTFEDEVECGSELDIIVKDSYIVRFKNTNNEYNYLYIDGKIRKFQIITEEELEKIIIENYRLSRKNDILKNVLSSENSNYLIYGWYDKNDETIYYYCEKDDTYLNIDSSYMFSELEFLSSVLGLESVNTSRVMIMDEMFSEVGSKTTTINLGSISNWDTSNVISMNHMFLNVGYRVTDVSLDLSHWDVSNVTNMSGMFTNFGNIANSIELSLANWNTSKVRDMSHMFSGYGKSLSVFSLDLSSFDTSSVHTMKGMFSGAGEESTSFDLDLSNFNTSNVEDMSSMFSSIGVNANTINLDLSSFNTSKVTNMQTMFSGYGKNLTNCELNISNFDTSNVKNMFGMFLGTCMNTSNIDLSLSNFNTSNVTDMMWMFSHFGENSTAFNLDLSNFDTSKVTSMNYMFYGTGANSTTFNLNLSSFNTSNVTSMESMFDGIGRNATTWSIGDLSNFDTSKVTNMYYMFSTAGRNATTFDLDLSSWNTSKVENMQNMFFRTGENSSEWSIGDLSNWDTSKVTNIAYIFSEAGKNATNWRSIGTLKIYASNVSAMFNENPNASAILNIYNSPDHYNMIFGSAATNENASIVVNYTSDVTNIDDIISTKSNNSHVTKGELLN